MTRLEQSRTYQKRSDPTQEGTHEKPKQARTCQEGTGEKRPEQYILKVASQNKPARTDETKLKRTAWTRAGRNRTTNQQMRTRKGRLDLSRAEQMIRDWI